jgi:hypothetical protein
MLVVDHFHETDRQMSGLLVIPAKSTTIVTFLFYKINIGITIVVVGAAICKPLYITRAQTFLPFLKYFM